MTYRQQAIRNGVNADYQRCLDAGLTVSETATVRGVTKAAVSQWSKKTGQKFSKANNRTSAMCLKHRDDYETLTTVGRYSPAEAVHILARPKRAISLPPMPTFTTQRHA